MSRKDIEHVYELSPVQQGMLFQTLYAPGSGVYVVQLSLRLAGDLDVAIFERAWRQVVERHPILRTGFYWEGLEKPLQVVYRKGDLAVARESWRDLAPDAQQERLERYLEAERARGFALGEAPLMRLALFELGERLYQFAWSHHHLLNDGWSQGLLMRELFTTYAALAQGQEPALPRPRPYREYIAWLQKQDLEKAEELWRHYLAGVSSPTLLAPGEGAQAAATDFRTSRSRRLQLGPADTTALRDTARRQRLTLNTLVQGAWALLLARSLDVRDVVFGVTVAGRPADLPGADAIIGPFINTLPMRVAVAPASPLASWLAKLQERQVELRRYEFVPLYQVQQWSEIAAGVPLFDNILAFENYPVDSTLASLLPGFQISGVRTNELTNFPLDLIVIPGTELSLEMRFDSSRFEDTAVTRLLEHLAVLLRGFVREREAPVWSLPLLGEGERQQVVVEWNDTPGGDAGPVCLPELVAAQAERSPEAVAVTSPAGHALTYGELRRRASRLAQCLRAIGVGPEERVGVLLDRSPEEVTSLLAVLEAGGAYVPLDPAWPRERAALVLEDASVRTLLTTADRAGVAAALPGRSPLLLDRQWDELGRSGAALPASGAGAGNLAYVIYTSGSTGRPKGVEIEHRGLSHLLAWHLRAFGVTAADRATRLSGLAFDAAVWELWPYLAAGASVHVPDEETRTSPAALHDWLLDQGITISFVSTPVAEALLPLPWPEPTPLRLLLTGGDRLHRHPGPLPFGLINNYGPTESTVVATSGPVLAWGQDDRPPDIGRPIDGTPVLLLDRELSPVPAGMVGELCVGGAGLARGYLAQPHLTAERFVPSPFAALWGEPGSRLYRTGDRARFLPAGAIEFLGRIDFQVKIRGLRIELGEIETALAAHPEVGEAVVLVREGLSGGAGEPRLVAYVAAPPGTAPEELRRWLRGRLPEAMVPSAFVRLDALPLTPNGKVDRQALGRIAPSQEGSGGRDGYAAPRTPVEEILAAVFAEVLRQERVGIHDSFFDLGGHSLLATQVVSRVRQALDMELALRELFEAPTVAGLAERLEQLRAGDAAPPPILPVPRSPQEDGEDVALPLSFAQQRLWFLERLEPGGIAYNVPLATRLTGDLAPGVLERSLTEIVRRHEVLRTTFVDRRGQPAQRIAPELRIPLPLIDLAALPADAHEAEALRLGLDQARRPFDLATGPLVRWSLLRLAPAEHVVLACAHHIVSDGWSMGILMRELGALYAAFSRGGASPLAPLPVQYADFAVWQRQWLAGEVLERELAYWRERLEGAPQALELPLDRPRPATRSGAGGTLLVAIPTALAAALAALSRAEGATLFMVLASSFQAVLGRWSGQRDVLVGTPVAGRSRREIEGLIGFFVNTLVLRAELAGVPSFRELLGRSRAAALDAFAHQALPFERLVEAVAPERGLTRSPLFQVMFAFHTLPQESEVLPGLDTSPFPLELGVTKFELTLALQDSAAGPTGTLEYDADLFDRSTAARLLAHFERFLQEIVADPERRIGEVPLLAPAERHQLLVEWNARQESGAPLCLHELVAVQGERAPDAVAVSCQDEHLTYGALERRAQGLARRLRRLGVGPDVPVAVCLERSVEMVTALLAVWQAGGAYVPLDPSYPDERLAFMVSDALEGIGQPVLLTQEALAGRFAGTVAQVLRLDEGHDPSSEAAPLPAAAVPENLAYVIYTSGSTGRPKGVMVSHGNAARLFAATQAWFDFGPRDVWSVFHSYAFDFSVWELWGALVTGGRAAIVPYWVSRSPEAFHRLLLEGGVTVLDQTPSAFRQLAAVDAAAGGPLALRLVIFGGEALDLAALDPWFQRHGDERPRLVNMYGITETTVHVTYRPVSRADLAAVPRSPIGVAIPDLTLQLLGPGAEPLPVGVVGEIHVGGAGLARGYLGRPELTAERFVPDPFAAESGARLYRAGDLARRLADGGLEFLGRLDHQVKIRGFRIELGEIEAALLSWPPVRGAVVLARPDRSGELGLTACVVPAAPGGADLDALRTHLRTRLPEHMVPATFVFLEALPLTANGKLDRQALLRLEPGADAQAATWIAPRTPAEAIVAAIFAEVLGRKRVGAHDGFFDLGGHSLLATQVTSRLREVLAVDLPLRELFEAPTVAALAERLEARRSERARGKGVQRAPAITPVPRPHEGGGDLPLSFAQQRLWFLDRFQPGEATYNVPLATRLTGTLDSWALERALAEVVHRHEVLRTTFADRGGSPVQVIAPELEVPLPCIDLAALPEPARQAEATRLAAAQARQPFDLAAGPLVRWWLLRLGTDEHAVLAAAHHIVSDAWSMGILTAELGALYAAFSRGEESPLAPLPVQYADFAVWQRRWLVGEVLERELAYWRDRLAGASQVLELPLDRPRRLQTAVRTGAGGTVPVVVTAAVAAALSELSRREGATLFMTLMSAFQALLGRWTGQEDVLVGTPVAGRTRREIEGLIGFFVNTLVLRAELAGSPPFRELLARARTTTLDAFAHQALPFERLVEAVAPERDMTRSPLFQVMFAFQNVPQGGTGIPGLSFSPLAVDVETAKFELMLTLAKSPAGLVGTLEYAADLFDRSTAARLASHLGRFLEETAADPTRRIGDVPLLAPAARHQLLMEWNDTGEGYARQMCLHELVEAQVDRSPDAVAVSFEGAELSYAELERRANRLAHRLRELGVGPEVPVAMCVERSLEMVVGLLAVLKAGGAYVPLDPDYPAERLAYMIESSGTRLLLAQSHLAPLLGGVQVLLLDAEPGPQGPAARPVGGAISGVAGDSLLYVIYTSGSTGRPKGVMVRHRGVVNRLLWADRAYPVRSADRILQKAPFSFDFSVWECFGPLLRGARLVLARPGGQRDGRYLARTVMEQGITLLHFVPAMLQAFLEEEGLEGCHSLRFVFSGGDALSSEVRDRFRARLPQGVLLRNQYGPTEISIDVTEWICGPVDGTSEGPGQPPIGRPIGNGRTYVVDAALEPVPIGIAGELLLGGDGVARGYLGRPDLTAERFVPDAWSREAGARVYRTGDRVRLRADGALEFQGRVDQQVKVRGYRIEPGEIETVLLGHPGVREVAVVARPDRLALVACVVPAEGAALAAEELRSFAHERLPEYMVPAGFMALDALPLTPSGKVDRQALRRLDLTADAGAGSPFLAPRSPAEEIVAAIFGEVLRRERVGAQDGFFELGGHSLLATQVVSRVREAFAVDLPLRDLFEAPTVAALAERIEQARGAGTLQAQAIVPVPREEDLPLSFAQQRLWFLDRFEPGGVAYNVPLATRMSGGLDPRALEQALAEVVRRHEVLRTTFAERGGSPVQVIAPDLQVPLPLADLAALPAPAREAETLRLATAQARQPFDLSTGPLVRWLLLRLGTGEANEHVVLATAHHIVSDAWSMGILVGELGALYAAFSRGDASPLPPLPVQYADFAVWQRRWLAGEVLESELAYWRERLAGAPHALELPLDRPRPAVPSGAGARIPVLIPPVLVAALSALSRREGATLFMTLAAAFQTLLGRWSGQNDVLVGTPVAGRTRREIEGLIGFFVNTLVLRAELAGSPPFRELLTRARAATLDAFAHQALPFERLVEAVVPERDLSRSPLFQVMFAFQNVPHGGAAIPGLALSPLPVDVEAAKFELMLTLAESAAGLTGTLDYATDLFDRSTAARLLSHFGRFLAEIAADPTRQTGEVPLLAPAERHQVLVEWNDTGEGFAGNLCLHELVARQVERSPDAVAVAFEGEELSYAELARRANCLANRLRALGVGPEVPVAMCVERSLAMVVGLLAVLEAGGAYVPLDPDYPAERLAYMIEDSGAPLLLAQSHLLAHLPAPAVRVLLLDDPATFEKTFEGDGLVEWPVGGAVPDSLLYIIYTSGSTGRPKGVMVRHRGVVNRLLWADRAYPVTSADRILQKAPFSFDFSVWECFGPLLRGARLVLARPGGQRDGRYLARTVIEQGITLLHFVPAMLQAFLEEEGLEGCHSLRFVFSGGDALSSEVRDRFRARLPQGVLLRNQYGPTEISIDVTEWICGQDDGPGQPRQPPIGRPLGNGQAYVVDAALQPVPVGVAGELLLGGEGVARGYRGRPDLTAERFVPNPWSAEPGARLYRTGDRVRLRPDGVLEFQGRVDQQVKVRGYRIEPGEIEAVLLGHPGVREIAVVARPDHLALVACVVPADGAAPAAEDLRSFARERLPEYMVPAGFVALDALPLTPSGKVDRSALQRLEHAAAGAPPTAPPVAPRTPAEEIVAAIFGAVLRRDRVGVHDGFFDLGGHSLLAAQVISRVREAFAVELPLRDLFEAPSVAALVERIEQARGEGTLQAPAIVPAPRSLEEDGGLPLSFSQQRLWFLERLAPGGIAYNVPLATRLSGALDPWGLERALAEVVRRHEVLRTTFGERDGDPVQVIAPELWIPLPLIDLAALPEPVREAQTRRLAMQQARQPFDLAAGPLVRWCLLRLDAEEHVVLATAHHIVSDAWSMGILVGELGALYAAFSQGDASPLPPLPPLPVQYADFAVWQRQWLEGEALERDLDYWRDRLAGAPQALELPLDRSRPAVRSGAGGTVPVVFPPALAAALAELSRRQGATLFMTLVSAFQTLLGRWSGQDDVLVGTPVAGRTRREIEGLIGFFVNTLVLRAELAGSPPFRELLTRARTTALDAFAHQSLPFERLVEAVAPERDLTRSPLFQVMFAFQNVPQGGGAAIPGLALSALPVDLEVAKFELMLTLGESPAGLVGTLEYDADLFDRSTAARLLSHLGRFLDAIAADPGRLTGEVALLAPAEQHQLLVEWNDAAADYAGAVCLHELVEAQVERSPDAVAVSFEGEELSYAELERRSNLLAHRLRELGVGPEVPVAMCVERSLVMVVGLLAVLKAGGAYVPLDPDYPAERLAFMIEDSGASLLLAQSHLVLRLPAGNTRVLLLDGADGAAGLVAGGPAARPVGGAVSGVAEDSLLYVIYTSGSTGRPKGVMVRHRGVVNRLLWADRAYPVTSADRILQKAPFSFDFSVWECFGPLLRGARLVLARPGGQRDGRYLARTVKEQGITLLHFVPAMLQAFLEEEGLEGCRSLRFVFSGGDALSSEVRDRFRARLPEGVLLRNQYGPTEISIDMTEWICGPGEETGDGRRQPRQPPIGRPIGNGQAYVVDAELAPAPVGVAGELLLGGEGVARGYRGRPDLTAERFIPGAWGGAAGARLYRTGDRARWLPDGNLEFLGRVDQQVKIRGYRIEPGEIESVLLTHPAVREVGVVTRGRGDRQLVACVVPAGAAAPLSDELPGELRSFARERLPEYMVPAAFLVLEALPLTPSGKLDRRALAALELAAKRKERTLVPPRTPVEETLVAIWRELLGVEEIGVEDSFFDLGGHSLLATRLFSRVQHAFGVDLSLRQVFQAPTIAALAQAIAEQLPPPEPTENDLDQLLDQLDMLSDEEVAARLAELADLADLSGESPGG